MKIDLEDALARLEDARFEDLDEAVANALFLVAVAYLERGRHEQALEHLDEAEYLCRKLENPDGLAHVELRMAQALLNRGELTQSEERVRHALAHFQAKNEITNQVTSLELLAQVLERQDRRQEAAEALEQGLAMMEEGQDPVGQVLMVQQLAPIYRALGELDKARAAYARLGRLADAMGDHERVALALVGLGSCLAGLGELERSLEALDQAREVYLELGQKQRAAMVVAEMARLRADKD